MDKTGVKNKEWQVIELGEIAKIETGSKNTQDKVDDGKYPFYVRSQEIEHIDTYSYDCEAIITAGDGVGVGKVYHYVKGKFDCHQRAYVITDFKNVTGKFLYYYLLNFFYRRVKRMSAKNSVDSVRMEMLSKMKINLPPLPEQQKIAEILSTQDKLIELQEKKIEQLKELKKAYLQKMFPQKGSKYPELRFKGFTDPWEQRKVGDHCDMFNGDRSSKYPNAQDMVTDGIPFINAGDLEDGHVNLVTCNKITREKYEDLGGAKLQLGDIVYCLRGTLGKNAYIDNFNEGTVASSLVALRPKDIDGRYLFHVLNSDIEYRQRVVHDEGAAQPNLSAKSVSEFIMLVPDIEEQKQISEFLDGLDNLITLHQRKSEQEKQKKKALMQLLLTGIARTK